MLHKKNIKIAIIVFEGVEELDVIGVLSPLNKASEATNDHEINTVTVGPKKFCGSNGLTMYSDIIIDDIFDFSSLDAIVLPGGKGSLKGGRDCSIKSFIKKARLANVRFYSVCSGVLLLLELDLLEGLEIACHSLKRHLFYDINCTVTKGVVRDKWLLSAGGFLPNNGLKAIEVAFHILNDFTPNLVDPVINRLEVWPQTLLSVAPLYEKSLLDAN